MNINDMVARTNALNRVIAPAEKKEEKPKKKTKKKKKAKPKEEKTLTALD